MSETTAKTCSTCGHDGLYFVNPLGFFCAKCGAHQRDEHTNIGVEVE